MRQEPDETMSAVARRTNRVRGNMGQKVHVLLQDDEAHWYLVPVEDKDTFNAMMDCDWDEITDDGWKLLDKWRIDSPHDIHFMWPISDG